MIITERTAVSVIAECQNSSVIQFAKAELEKYLVKTLQVVTREGIPFYLQLSQNSDSPEQTHIHITDKGIWIIGSDERAVLYGVYEFLERYVGCSFGAMAHPEVRMGEFIPSLSSLELPEEEYRHQADLPYRTAIVQFDVWAGEAERGLALPFFDWLAKNKYNRILLWASCYEKLKTLGMLPELEKRGFRLTVGHHQATFTFLPPFSNEFFPTEYRNTNPEYFRLLGDGTRFTPKSATSYNGQLLLCNRNKQCQQAVADNILHYLEQNPLIDAIAFWPNDGVSESCLCPDCSAHTKMQNYLHFNNELARLVSAKRPDVRIDTLVYMDLWDLPEGTELNENIIIDMAMWHEKLPRPCGQKDGLCILGTVYEENLKSFRAHCKNVVAYDYYMGNYGNHQKIIPAADEMQSVFKWMKQQGISGSGTQIECFNHWNNLFNFYCFARSAYDVSLSVEQQIERFVRLFGKGAPMVREILRLYESTIEGQISIHHTGTYLVEHIDKQRIYSLFDQALQTAQTPLARNNLRMFRMAFRYSDLTVADPITAKGSKPVQFEDATGELSYMATHFDSYFAHHTGYGIALPIANRTDSPAPNEWYCFE